MVFSFFKKPPPEKMTARPAATPTRPKSAEAAPPKPAPTATPASASASAPASAPTPAPVSSPRAPAAEAKKATPSSAKAVENKGAEPRDLPPLDFSRPADFSTVSQSFGEIHVENDMDPVDADIEQATMLYANAQDDATRALLENVVRIHQSGSGERLWLMLFDLYRLSGQHAPFDALSLEYARVFEKSPPTWRNNEDQKTAGPAAAPAGTVLFKGELTGDNDAAFAVLDQAVDKNPRLRVELTKVKSVDDLGAERMLGFLAKVSKKKCELNLVGRDALAALLEARVESGRREESGCWLLLLELYQLMGKHDAFEEMAINYAITFEMSPPSWEQKRVVATEPQPAPALATDIAADVKRFAPKGDLKAERFPGLQAFAENEDPVVLDFSAVTRIDFVSAGTLVNMLTPLKRQGKRVIVSHPNLLVAELLCLVGLPAVAEIALVKT